jgi:hypothetical protein
MRALSIICYAKPKLTDWRVHRHTILKMHRKRRRRRRKKKKKKQLNQKCYKTLNSTHVNIA